MQNEWEREREYKVREREYGGDKHISIEIIYCENNYIVDRRYLLFVWEVLYHTTLLFAFFLIILFHFVVIGNGTELWFTMPQKWETGSQGNMKTVKQSENERHVVVWSKAASLRLHWSVCVCVLVCMFVCVCVICVKGLHVLYTCVRICVLFLLTVRFKTQTKSNHWGHFVHHVTQHKEAGRPANKTCSF